MRRTRQITAAITALAAPAALAAALVTGPAAAAAKAAGPAVPCFCAHSGLSGLADGPDMKYHD